MSTIIRVYNSRDSTVDLESIKEFKKPLRCILYTRYRLANDYRTQGRGGIHSWLLRIQEILSE